MACGRNGCRALEARWLCHVCSEGGYASMWGVCLCALEAERSDCEPEVSSQGAGSDITVLCLTSSGAAKDGERMTPQRRPRPHSRSWLLDCVCAGALAHRSAFNWSTTFNATVFNMGSGESKGSSRATMVRSLIVLLSLLVGIQSYKLHHIELVNVRLLFSLA